MEKDEYSETKELLANVFAAANEVIDEDKKADEFDAKVSSRAVKRIFNEAITGIMKYEKDGELPDTLEVDLNSPVAAVAGKDVVVAKAFSDQAYQKLYDLEENPYNPLKLAKELAEKYKLDSDKDDE